MLENTHVVKTTTDTAKVYCHEDYAQDLYNLMMNENPCSKDIKDGDLVRIINYKLTNDQEVEVICDNHISLFFDISKEKKYLDIIGFDEDRFRNWISSGSHREHLDTHKTYILVENSRARKGSIYAAHLTTIVTEFKEQIVNPTAAYIAKVLNKNQGGFIVDVQGIKAFLPGSLAAANKITDFESFIGKEIHVMIEDFLQPSNMFIVSYKKYLDNILPSKLAQLERNQHLTGTITGTSKFGIFIEIADIFTGLLHTAEMNDHTIEKFNAKQFAIGATMESWLKDIRDNKLILTQVDPSIRQNEMELLREDIEGGMKEATIVAIKPHGALMEIRDNIANKNVLGLLPVKEMRKTGKRLNIGDRLEIFIKKVDSSTGKIYLTLTDEQVTTEL